MCVYHVCYCQAKLYQNVENYINAVGNYISICETQWGKPCCCHSSRISADLTVNANVLQGNAN